VTVTKWPSVLCVRAGMPGYPQASHPSVLPGGLPRRTAASAGLLRTSASNVNVSVWLWGEPLLTRKIVAALLPLMSRGSEVWSTASQSSAMLKLPLLSAKLVEPVTPLTSADPKPPKSSLVTASWPTKLVLMSRR